ncbi:MAG: hypothetical protein PHE89_02765 [Alphaproteobacteria bacterium]|nr:hypothetical protein [Alphaproteobacteria bacterium]
MKKQEFLEKIKDFLTRTGMSPTTLGVKALREPNFVFTVYKGRECREETQTRVIDFMRDYETKGDGNADD